MVALVDGEDEVSDLADAAGVCDDLCPFLRVIGDRDDLLSAEAPHVLLEEADELGRSRGDETVLDGTDSEEPGHFFDDVILVGVLLCADPATQVDRRLGVFDGHCPP